MIPEIAGKRLRLRLVVPGDAAFIHRLRTGPAHNAHLSPVTGTVEDQNAWISKSGIVKASKSGIL